jgi:DNA-binding MarR family transcriptional regulator
MANLEEDIKSSNFRSEFEKVMINMFFTGHFIDDLHTGLFKRHSLTTPQFNVLRILRGQHPNPSTVNMLIERMLDKSSNASRRVDKLVDKLLVKRVQCKKDRRAVDVIISDQGLGLLKKIDVELQKLQTDMCNLSEEESLQLNQLLDKLRA